MVWSWLAKRRRQRLLAAPFPQEWQDYLRKNVAVFVLLTENEQSKLCDELRVFVAEKTWEGCGGLVLTDEIKVTIAAQACLLLLGIGRDSFRKVRTILVYPSTYRASAGEVDDAGVVHEGVGRLGEAWYRGPVVLGWEAVRVGGQDHRDGHNVVLHEFAHQLDFLDGLADGTPPLGRQEQYHRWHDVMTAEYARLVEDTQRGTATVLDTYGATNPVEFFAVATEAFFEKPLPMRQQHAELYEILRDYYQQDPAVWFLRAKGVTEKPPESPPTTSASAPPFRGSREKSPITRQGKSVTLSWPGWVRFWELGLFLSRPQAVERVWTLACGCLLLAGAAWLSSAVIASLSNSEVSWDAADGYPILYSLVPFAPGAVAAPVLCWCLTGLFGASAVWLRLAIGWVDRREGWGKKTLILGSAEVAEHHAVHTRTPR